MPDLVAHRGRRSFDAHENIVPSLVGLPSWVTGVEIDVRLTSDLVPVLMHDATVDRTTNGTGAVASLTLAQIKALDAGDEAEVPTLAEYLQAVASLQATLPMARVLLDMKVESATAITQTVAAVNGAPAVARAACIFMVSNNESTGQEIRAQSATARIGSFSVTPANVHDTITWMEDVGGELFLTPPNAYEANRDIVPIVQGAGHAAGTSTNNDIDSIELAVADGVDMVLSDIALDLDWWPDPPGPPPPPTPEIPLGDGSISPVVTWLGCDLVTGRIIADLPDMTGQISRLLGAHTSASLKLPIPLSGRAALGDLAFQATTPGRTMIVAVVNDQPAWGGRVLRRRGGTDANLELACATLEAYLTRRRVRDHTFSQVDEATIMATLLGDAGPRDVPGLGSVGGIGLEIDAPLVGVLADDEYLRTDRVTVYDRLRERSARLGGLEWTIELLWGDDTQTFVRKVVRVRPRIGIATDTPNAIFETTAAGVFSTQGASEARYHYDEDYSEARGATWVEAYAPGEGDDQPSSAPAIATEQLANGWPIDEHHWQPSSSIQTVSVLNDHAQSTLELRRNGARTWEIEARWNVYPRMNIDWRLGDDVAWKLIGHRHPNGVTGQGRCIGWALDPEGGTVQPILLDPSSDDGGN